MFLVFVYHHPSLQLHQIISASSNHLSFTNLLLSTLQKLSKCSSPSPSSLPSQLSRAQPPLPLDKFWKSQISRKLPVIAPRLLDPSYKPPSPISGSLRILDSVVQVLLSLVKVRISRRPPKFLPKPTQSNFL